MSPGAAVRALRRHPFRLASALCLVAACVFAAAEPGWTSHQLALSLGPRTVGYSELFFTSTAVGSHFTPGADNSVGFAIVNREGRTVRYHYVVTLTGPSGAITSEPGQALVPDNQKATRFATFNLPLANTTYTVSVKLLQPTYSIELHGRTT